MHIIHFTTIACIRFVKQALLGIASGHAIHPLVDLIGGNDLPYMLPMWGFWRAKEESNLYHALQLEDAIWHIHTDPPGLARRVKKLNPKAKIVLDVHDASWGWGETPTADEAGDLEAASAVIVPSYAYKKRCPHKDVTQIRSGWIYNPKCRSYIGGVAYEGGLSVGGWRDHRVAFRALSSARAQVYAYSANADKVKDAYDSCHIEHCEYHEMGERLTRHEWALVATPEDGNARYKTSFPNKFGESLASNLAILTYGIPEVSKIVKATNCGIVFTDEGDFLRTIEQGGVPDARPYADGVKEAKKLMYHGTQENSKLLCDCYERVANRTA